MCKRFYTGLLNLNLQMYTYVFKILRGFESKTGYIGNWNVGDSIYYVPFQVSSAYVNVYNCVCRASVE